MPERGAILILVENLPVPLDRRVWQESCALRDAGYQVIVICPKMRGYVKSEEFLDGIQIYRHWISDEAGGLAGFLGEYASALWGEFHLACKAWWRHRFRVIHLCNPPDLLFLVALPFKLLGVKVVYDIHDAWPEMFEAKFRRRGLLYWAVRVAERLTHAVADTVLATNQSTRAIAWERGGKATDEVFIVRTAPKIATQETPTNPALKKGRRYLVGYVGVMGDADGVRYAIEAAEYLVRKRGRSDIQFLLMGVGPEYQRLIAMRDEKGLQEHVDLPGRVSNEFLFAALKTMDLGISCDPINPYNDHCTMNKVLEYMAFGKPQVLFDLKEGRFSAGDAAVYVGENSPIALGETIAAVLDDPDSRERMGRRGLERFKSELNWERSVQQLLLAYHRTLQP
ncbi:MAG: glycosyltransferase family 4 protein [Verrucomicrobia bacterium]|nr:glycosyltransferase family 4 protein [Verrucomicrobiota bacterium]MBI3868569.1 glycosyltransferase family 4 protein [Verrucomicrobiota bacterium]